jgi:UvrD-like helicase C-terminal domain
MEFDVVIMPMSVSFSFMLARNLLYTAVSRGKRRVVIIGEAEALMKAACSVRGACRITKLAEFLNPELDWAAQTPDMASISNLELERAAPEPAAPDRVNMLVEF